MEVDEDTPQITDYHFTSGKITRNALEVIETIDVSNHPVKEKKRNSNAYDKNLCKDNKELTAFINKCIFLDPTTGMETVINKVLLPSYVKADKEYKQSGKFTKVITKALQRLIKDPERKYTHISDVVDTLKFHVSSGPKRVKVSTSQKSASTLNSYSPIIISSKSVNDTTKHKPVINSISREPINVSKSHTPLNVSPSSKPVNRSTSHKIMNVSPSSKPVNDSTSHKIMNVSPSSKPVNRSTSHKIMKVLPSSKPVNFSTSHKIMNVSPSSKPMNDSTSHKSTNVSPSSKPVLGLPSTKPTVSPSPKTVNDSTSEQGIRKVKNMNVSPSSKPVNIATPHKAMNVSTPPKPFNESTSPKPANDSRTPKAVNDAPSSKQADDSRHPKAVNDATSPKLANDSRPPKVVNDATSSKSVNVSTSHKPMKVSTSLKPSPPPVKKRVDFITLSTKVSVKPNQIGKKRPMIDSKNKVSPKKSKREAIILDCDDDDVIPIDDEHNFSNQVNAHFRYNDEIDYLVSGDTIEIQDSQELKITEDNGDKENEQLSNKTNEITNSHDQDNETDHENDNLGSNENLNDLNKLLVPCKEKIVRLEKPKLKKKKEPAKTPEQMTEDEKAKRIKEIEAKIEKCNSTIAKLDLEEVTDDSANSPYYKCDRLRATIVKLYKELCSLAGDEQPERPKIRLQVKEGVPHGPIKRLEKLLNKRADEEGETPFPDFSDVMGCVERANEKDGLGWSKAKIMKEAQAIFTYTGRYLQKRRQQREWKHLRAIARPEEFEADPAERDQELQARLEANRLLAGQREAEVFSRFSRMVDPEPEASTSFQIEEPPPEDSSSDEETETTQNLLKDNNSNNINKTQSNIIDTGVKQTSIDTGVIQTSIDTGVIQTSIDTGVIQRSINTGVIQTSIDTNVIQNNIMETDVIIKEEPEDIPIKIQYQGDISLVIEISDSESEDECGVLTF